MHKNLEARHSGMDAGMTGFFGFKLKMEGFDYDAPTSLCVSSHSRSAAFMRVCQPGPSA